MRWLDAVCHLIANTWKLKWRNETKYHTVLSVPLCHAMHPDRTRSQHKTSAEPWSWSQNATDVDSKQDFDKHWEFNHKQSHLLNKWDQKYLNGFIGKWATQSDNEKILMLWLLDDNRRVRGFNKYKKEGHLLTPGSTITLTTGMAADLKPKA